MENLSEVNLTNPDLSHRMALYVPGQATWPMLNTSLQCKQCRHWQAATKSKGKGFCGLVQKLNKRLRKVLFPGASPACPQFEASAD